ncbi:MAG: acyl carrier protein [Armatimonadetes bacterium]|nr:acyl carrier protein [Armatimonadota bacterium]
MNQEIFAKVRAVVAQELDIDESTVEPTSHFINDLGGDSIDFVEFVMGLEEAFNLTIPDDEAETLFVMADVVAYIERRV